MLRRRDRERLALAIAYVLSLWASLASVRHDNNLFVSLSYCALALPVMLAAVEARRPSRVGRAAVAVIATTVVACLPAVAQGVTSYGLASSRQPLTCYDRESGKRSTHQVGVSALFTQVAADRPILSIGTLFAARSAYIARQPATVRWQFVDRSWARSTGAADAQTRYLWDRTFPFVWLHVDGLDGRDDLRSQIATAPRIPTAQAIALNRNYVPVLTCNNEILLRIR